MDSEVRGYESEMIEKLEKHLEEMIRKYELFEKQGDISEYGQGKRDTYIELLGMINDYFGTNEEATQ